MYSGMHLMKMLSNSMPACANRAGRAFRPLVATAACRLGFADLCGAVDQSVAPVTARKCMLGVA